MATAVWSPALALSQGKRVRSRFLSYISSKALRLTVTGMSAYIAVTANMVVCAIYTAIVQFQRFACVVLRSVKTFTLLGRIQSSALDRYVPVYVNDREYIHGPL